MPIETSRIESGILFTKSTGTSTFAELSQSRVEGIRLLEDAGDHAWVLVMDVAHARLPRPDMNVDSLRGVTKQNLEVNLVGYVVLGAHPALKLMMKAYGALFKVPIHFDSSYDAALATARAMLAEHKQ
jgi:hypothetical protein